MAGAHRGSGHVVDGPSDEYSIVGGIWAVFRPAPAEEISDDLCYRPQPFDNDRQRVEYLFGLYEKLTAPLIAPAKKKRRPSRAN